MSARTHTAGLALCAAAFLGGVAWLMHMRFAAGDVYPPYSSLRADPLGTMAYYEALERQHGITLSRDFTDTNRLPGAPDTTYLHLAGEPYQWGWLTREMMAEINGFMRRGGRLVIAFYPSMSDDETWRERWERAREEHEEQESEKENDPGEDEGENPGEEESGGNDDSAGQDKTRRAGDGDDEAEQPDEEEAPRRNRRAVEVKDFWGVEYGFAGLTASAASFEPAPALNRSNLPLPETVDWHSGMIFKNLDPAWRVIYARSAGPVLIERQFVRGSVVLVSDSFFTSNEAVRDDRHPGLLAWLVGGNRNIVFDENHFGIYHRRGVATLLRHYGLDSFIGALLVLAGLFIWKNSTSLVPRQSEKRDRPAPTGRAAAGGFINLLHRHVAPADLLDVSLKEWSKTPPRVLPAWKLEAIHAIAAAESALPRRRRDPAAASRHIAEILRRTAPPPSAPPANTQPTPN